MQHVVALMPLQPRDDVCATSRTSVVVSLKEAADMWVAHSQLSLALRKQVLLQDQHSKTTPALAIWALRSQIETSSLVVRQSSITSWWDPAQPVAV